MDKQNKMLFNKRFCDMTVKFPQKTTCHRLV